MARGHEHYEELAVGHVLGGLDAADAASFRSHLLGCRDCRQRVAELRDIAAELAAAERDERQQARVQTETETEERTEVERRDDGPPPGALTTRHVTLAIVVVLLLAGVLAFWNLQLRTTVDVYAGVAESRGDALRGLATGVGVPADVADGLTAVVAVDGEHVAFTVAGLAGLHEAERVVAWLLGGEDGVRPGLVARGDQLDDGVFAGQVDDGGATELVITRERGEVTGGPSGDELVRAEVRATAGG